MKQGPATLSLLVLQKVSICATIGAMLTTKKKANIIKKSQIHGKDTGSPEVQIAMISERIDELSMHLKKHKKDNHSRRGLIKMVADRRKHLKHLEKADSARHAKVVKKLKEIA